MTHSLLPASALRLLSARCELIAMYRPSLGACWDGLAGQTTKSYVECQASGRQPKTNWPPNMVAKLVAMEAFMKGNDVFVALPTGYEKSVIVGTLPAAYDILRGHIYGEQVHRYCLQRMDIQ